MLSSVHWVARVIRINKRKKHQRFVLLHLPWANQRFRLLLWWTLDLRKLTTGNQYQPILGDISVIGGFWQDLILFVVVFSSAMTTVMTDDASDFLHAVMLVITTLIPVEMMMRVWSVGCLTNITTIIRANTMHQLQLQLKQPRQSRQCLPSHPPLLVPRHRPRHLRMWNLYAISISQFILLWLVVYVALTVFS